MEKECPKMIAQKTILSMGWTKAMIDKLLPEPELKENPHYWRGAPMKLWPEALVKSIMETEEYRTEKEKADRRKKSMQNVAETHKRPVRRKNRNVDHLDRIMWLHNELRKYQLPEEKEENKIIELYGHYYRKLKRRGLTRITIVDIKEEYVTYIESHVMKEDLLSGYFSMPIRCTCRKNNVITQISPQHKRIFEETDKENDLMAEEWWRLKESLT